MSRKNVIIRFVIESNTTHLGRHILFINDTNIKVDGFFIT